MSALSSAGQAAFDAQKTLRIGDEAPDFKAPSNLGDIHFHDYIKNHWAILFSHPGDFTPVCTTELGRVAQLKDEWAKRGVKVLGLSVDTVAQHLEWLKDVDEVGRCHVDYPVLADVDRKISIAYGMLDQTKAGDAGLPLTVRSVFIIGPDRKIKLIITYPASTGRNFDEILRVIDSLQLTSVHKLATPVDWVKGKDAIIVTAVKDDEAHKLFPAGFNKVKPYLRYVPDPTAKKN